MPAMFGARRALMGRPNIKLLAGLTLTDISRPATALSKTPVLLGASNIGGVVVNTGEPIAMLRARISTDIVFAFNSVSPGDTSATLHKAAQMGYGGKDSGEILANFQAHATGYPAQLPKPMHIEWGLNDFNSGATNYTPRWSIQMTANYQTAASINAGATNWFEHYPWDNDNAMGTSPGAEHRALITRANAQFGRLSIDNRAYLVMRRRLEGVAIGSGTADDIAMRQGYLPYTYRAGGANRFAKVSYPLLTHASGNTASTAPTDLSAPDGTLSWDTSPAVNAQATNRYWRKYGAPGAGSWGQIDNIHLSDWGNDAASLSRADANAADEGFGPPFLQPARFRCPKDAAAGTVVGQLVWTGTATQFSLVNYDGSPVTEYAVDNSGKVTRTAAGTLPLNGMEFVGLAKGGTSNPGVLPGPVRIHSTRASTVTAPQLRPVSAPGIMLAANTSNGMANGKQVSSVHWFKSGSSIPAGTFISLLNRTGTIFSVFTAGTSLRFTAKDSAGSDVTNTNAAIGTNLWVADTEYVIYTANDFATGASSVYIIKGGVETGYTLASMVATNDLPLAGLTSLQMLGGTAPKGNFDGSGLILATGGALGLSMLTDGYIDWTVAANRRALFSATGVPVSRTAWSPIGGVTPKLESWGDKDDWLFGSPDGSIDKGFILPSHRTYELMTA